MKMVKTLTACLLIFTLLLLPCRSAEAQCLTCDSDDEFYIVTVIEETPVPTISTLSATKTKTASKTTYYQDSSGTTLWYVKVTATFSYDGTSASCTAAFVTAVSCSSSWKVSNKKCSYSGNSATASATGKKYDNSKVILTVGKSVTLSCSKNGTLS